MTPHPSHAAWSLAKDLCRGGAGRPEQVSAWLGSTAPVSAIEMVAGRAWESMVGVGNLIKESHSASLNGMVKEERSM